MAKAIGIDLGTTNSVVAVMEGGQPTVIINAEGNRVTASVVGYAKNGERLVGQLARRQAVMNPENTVYSAKRFIGRRHAEVLSEAKNLPFRIVAGPGDSVRFDVAGKLTSPEEVSGQILRRLTEDASRYLGEKVTDAVITVPAYFNDAQRQATKDAGVIAGLKVLRIINEPTAAALAYGLEKKGNETILVFDLGGGTFDVSLLDVGDGVFEVKSTAGDTHLGGDDFDKRVVDWMAEAFEKQQGIDLRKDRQALQRLTEAAEKAKIELSSQVEASLSLPFVTADAAGPRHLEMKLTRAKFDQLTADLVERCVAPFKQALADSKLTERDIDEVVLVGGSTRIPAVQALVRKLTGGKEPNQSVNPDEVVAVGAAIQAAVLAGEVKGIVLLDVTPLSLGIETLGGVTTHLVERNTTIGSTQLPKDEIDRMVADAKSHGAEDKQRREEVEARNAADAIAFQVEREIQTKADFVPLNEKARAEQLIVEVRTLVKGVSGDVHRLRRLTDDLRQLAAGLAAAEPPPAGVPAPPGSEAPRDVVDAEYTRK